MKTKPSRNGKKFSAPWAEIEDLYHKLLYWFYDRGNRRNALKYCDRLEELLRQEAPDHQAILGEECWSLLHEAKGELSKAIAYRENEIRLIKKLRRISIGTPSGAFVLDRYGPSDLCDRLYLLAVLYHEAGDLETALRVVRRSKRYCAAHGIPFEGDDLLRDYMAERRSKSKAVAEVAALPRRRGA